MIWIKLKIILLRGKSKYLITKKTLLKILILINLVNQARNMYVCYVCYVWYYDYVCYLWMNKWINEWYHAKCKKKDA